jgi:integrase/recombinase XerD
VKVYVLRSGVFMRHFNKPADQLGEAEFRAFLQYLHEERGLQSASVNGYNSALRFLYEVTLEQNLNYKRLPRLKEPILLPNVLTKEEIHSLFSVIEKPRDQALFFNIYGSGLRLGEIRRLRIQDIDSKQMRLFIHQGKGKRDRFTVLSQLGLHALREYWKHARPKHPCGYLFLNRDGTDCITERTVQDAFERYLKKAGITHHATVHTLRHSYATHLLENGTSIFYIRQLLGHSTIWTTTRYLHVANTDILNTASPLDTMSEKKKRGRPRKVKTDD